VTRDLLTVVFRTTVRTTAQIRRIPALLLADALDLRGQGRDRVLELTAAIRVVAEHVEARTGRRQQHRASGPDAREPQSHRFGHRRRIADGDGVAERLAELRLRFAYRDDHGAARAERFAQASEVAAFVTAADDDGEIAIEAFDRAFRRFDVR